MDKKDTDWIDHASYEDLLRFVRLAEVGHRFFIKGTNLALYFEDAYRTAHNNTSATDCVKASKAIGIPLVQIRR